MDLSARQTNPIEKITPVEKIAPVENSTENETSDKLFHPTKERG